MNIKERYIIPQCRAENIGGEDSIAEATIGQGSKYDPTQPVLVREHEDGFGDMWQEASSGNSSDGSYNVWDNAW